MKFSNKKSYLLLIISIPLLMLHTGCQKFVEADPPVTQLATESVFANNATATAALLNIYMGLNNMSYQLERFTGMSADEFTYYAAVATQRNYYTNTVSTLSDDGFAVSSLWNNSYNYIFQANSILNGLEKSAGISPGVKQQITGEAKFIRAFCHFYLVNLYGDVPIVTSSDYRINGSIPRSPKTQVYQQIISDLTDAKELLNSGFVDATDTTVYPVATAERVRPTKAAASAMLARAYLYTGDWVNAEAEASVVISNTSMFSLISDLNKVFLKTGVPAGFTNTEAIWQGMLTPTNFRTQEGAFFILTAAPTTSSAGVALSNLLLNAFEANDQRKTKWIASFTTTTAPITTYYFPNKFKAGSNATVQTEYQMYLRLAEQYLIRAEARAKQNNISGALADLNIIRNRAGLLNYSGATDQASVLIAIARERQVELFTEWGDRWFNMKRNGTIDAIMTAVTPLKGGTGWQSYQQLYPIAQQELSNNPNLVQTTGY